jgi:hypothetical protein
MNKIVEIFKAWNIAFNPNDSQSALAAKRIEICNSCENKKEVPIIHCGLCGCALKAKIYSPVENACPAGKWASVDKDGFGMKTNYDKLKEQQN